MIRTLMLATLILADVAPSCGERPRPRPEPREPSTPAQAQAVPPSAGDPAERAAAPDPGAPAATGPGVAAAPSAAVPDTAPPSAAAPAPAPPARAEPWRTNPGPAAAAAQKAARASFGRLLDQGRKQVRAGQYAEGMSSLREALKQSPDHAAALGELGWAAFKAGELDLARRTTTRALSRATLGERKGALLYNLGRIAESEGDKADAVACYRSSLLERDNATVRERLASLAGTAALPPLEGAAALCPAAMAEWMCAPVDARRDTEDVDDMLGECTCEVGQRLEAPPGAEGFLGAALLVVAGSQGGGGAIDGALSLVVQTATGGWQMVGLVADNSSPGVSYIHHSAEVHRFELSDAVPGGALELVLERTQSDVDGDYGVNTLEYEATRRLTVCWSGADAACMTLPARVAWGVEPMLDSEGKASPGDTWERSWEQSVSFAADGAVTVAPKGPAPAGISAELKALVGRHTRVEALRLEAIDAVALR